MSGTLDVSVIINVNSSSPERIDFSVMSILKELEGFKSEVVITSASGSAHYLSEFATDNVNCRIPSFLGEDENLSQRLNAALAETSGDIIVVMDDCMTFAPGCVTDLVASVRSRAKVAVVVPGREMSSSYTEELVEHNPEFWEKINSTPQSRNIWNHGSCIVARRDDVLRIRGFDESSSRHGLEFLDFKVRLKRYGVILSQEALNTARIILTPVLSSGDKILPASSPTVLNEEIKLVEKEKTYVRNVKEWKYRPADAPPLVTVAIATQNRAQYIKDCISSVLMQTVQDFELIIVDDGSVDDTKNVIFSITDPRIKYIYQESSGIAAARNAIADVSNGTFTAVHDDDDIMLPWRLETSIAGITESVNASYGSWVNFDDTTGSMVLHVVKEQFCMAVSLVNGQTPGHATWLVETDLIRKFRYNETISSAVDHNLALRMMRSGVKWTHTGRVLFLRRIHPDQVSYSDARRQKYAAELSRFMLRMAGSVHDIDLLKAESKAIGWPAIAEKGHLEEHFSKYLPDHLTNRRVTIQGAVANKASLLSKMGNTNFIMSEANSDGRVVAEFSEFNNVSLADLALMRILGIDGTVEGSLSPIESREVEDPQTQLDYALKARFEALLGKVTRKGKQAALVVHPQKVSSEQKTNSGVAPSEIRMICAVVSSDVRADLVVHAYTSQDDAFRELNDGMSLDTRSFIYRRTSPDLSKEWNFRTIDASAEGNS